MTDSHNDTPSVVDKTRPVAAGAPVVGAHFLNNTAVFVLAEEALLLVDDDAPDAPRRVAIHDGAILCAVSDGKRIITGGDDGKVIATDANGQSETIATDAKRRWIDHVAIGPDGAIAWSAGKQAFVKTAKALRQLDLPSGVGGLAFLPKGFRLAISHYNGATLWFPNAPAAKPEVLEWKGSHLDVTVSPDGRFLVTAMQESTLHGWRLADGKHMRMSGYATKVRSTDWSPGGKWLATAGSNQLVLWPFQSKDGPMGKQPTILAPADSRVGQVACHPVQEVCAAGFDDGLLLLVRIEDGAEVLAKAPGAAPITGLAWNAAGNRLAFGTDDGEAGVIAL